MNQATQLVYEQVMALGEGDRADLLALLNDSFAIGEGPDYTAEWEAEIRQRIREVESGDVTPIPWREAIEQIRLGEGDQD